MKRKFDSMRIAEKETGVPHSNISMCCRGLIKHAGEYQWELYNNQDKETINGQESSI
jgi:hypothetical protein